VQDDLAAFGLPIDAFAEAAAAEDEPHCIVDAENWPAVRVFLALQTQWRKEYAGMSGMLVWHGLRYSEAYTVLQAMGYQAKAGEIMESLRVMESAALPLLNKQN
jgi:hypothetical protein